MGSATVLLIATSELLVSQSAPKPQPSTILLPTLQVQKARGPEQTFHDLQKVNMHFLAVSAALMLPLYSEIRNHPNGDVSGFNAWRWPKFRIGTFYSAQLERRRSD